MLLRKLMMPNYTNQEVEALLDSIGLSSLKSSATEIAADLAERSQLNKSLLDLVKNAEVSSIILDLTQEYWRPQKS